MSPQAASVLNELKRGVYHMSWGVSWRLGIPKASVRRSLQELRDEKKITLKKGVARLVR